MFQLPGNEAADGLPACGLNDRGRLAPLFVKGSLVDAGSYVDTVIRLVLFGRGSYDTLCS